MRERILLPELRSIARNSKSPRNRLDNQATKKEAPQSAVQRESSGEPKAKLPMADPLASARHGTSGSGEPLPYLSTIQKSFGQHDVSDVIAHADAKAGEGARAMAAKAFTSGGHVGFAAKPSLHTTAHEAAHVVQQRAGVNLPSGVGKDNDAHERHADAVADLVVRGQPSDWLLDTYARSSGSGTGQAAAQQNPAAGGAVQLLKDKELEEFLQSVEPDIAYLSPVEQLEMRKEAQTVGAEAKTRADARVHWQQALQKKGINQNNNLLSNNNNAQKDDNPEKLEAEKQIDPKSTWTELKLDWRKNIAIVKSLLSPELLSHFTSVKKFSSQLTDKTDIDLSMAIEKQARIKLSKQSKKALLKIQKKEVDEEVASWSLNQTIAALDQNAADFLKNEEEGQAVIHKTEKADEPIMKSSQLVAFDCGDLGSGVMEIFQSESDTLLFASHGFTKSEGHRPSAQTRAFGFMAEPYVSVARTLEDKAAIELYKSYKKTMSEKPEPFTANQKVPDVACYPHLGSDVIMKEGAFFEGLTGDFDIAILRDWTWGNSKAASALRLQYVNTVPLQVLLDFAKMKAGKQLGSYTKLVLQVCRAPWHRSVPMEGGNERASASKVLQPW